MLKKVLLCLISVAMVLSSAVCVFAEEAEGEKTVVSSKETYKAFMEYIHPYRESEYTHTNSFGDKLTIAPRNPILSDYKLEGIVYATEYGVYMRRSDENTMVDAYIEGDKAIISLRSYEIYDSNKGCETVENHVFDRNESQFEIITTRRNYHFNAGETTKYYDGDPVTKTDVYVLTKRKSVTLSDTSERVAAKEAIINNDLANKLAENTDYQVKFEIKDITDDVNKDEIDKAISTNANDDVRYAQIDLIVDNQEANNNAVNFQVNVEEMFGETNNSQRAYYAVADHKAVDSNDTDEVLVYGPLSVNSEGNVTVQADKLSTWAFYYVDEKNPAAVKSAVYNEQSDSIDVVCDDADYYNSIRSLYLKEDWYTGIEDTQNITFDQSTLSFSITTLNGIGMNNGAFTFKIVADGYEDYTLDYTISKYGNGESGEQYKDNFPKDFSVEVNDDGDLVIYSGDEEFLDAFVKDFTDQENDAVRGYAGPFYNNDRDNNIPSYFFGAHNCVEGERVFRPLKRDGNLVILSVEDQLNKEDTQIYRGMILNDVDYTMEFYAEGYGYHQLNGTLKFPKANVRIPTNDIGVYVTGDYLIVSAKTSAGADFISKIYASGIALLDKYGVAINYIGAGEHVTSRDYDTIRGTDLVYRMNTKNISDITDWVALIDAEGYGQYCWDGRTFGGVVNISVDRFNINLRDINGDISKSQNAIGIYELPAISPVDGKVVQGWRVRDKEKDALRYVGEEIFITADTEIYAIYKDEPYSADSEENKVDIDSIKDEIILNTVTKLRVENALNADLANDSFVGDDAKNSGAVIWVEAVEMGDESDEYLLAKKILDNKQDDDFDGYFYVMDVNVFILANGQETPVRVSETENEVVITIDLSNNDELRKLAEEGKLAMFSVHNGGEETVTRGTYYKATKTYVFKSSKFSTFTFYGGEADLSTVVSPTPAVKPSGPVKPVVNTAVK